MAWQEKKIKKVFFWRPKYCVRDTLLMSTCLPRTSIMENSDLPKTVTKRELVQRISDKSGQTKVLVRSIVQQFLEEVSDELVRGNRLEFRKFGVFEVRNRPGRIAQNPKSLEKVVVPAKRVVKFKVGNVLKKRVESPKVNEDNSLD